MKPIILTFSGHDPSGGAGIQADIETFNTLACHCAPITTALTVQDSKNVYQIHPVPVPILKAQIEAILNDFAISAIKIGLLGNLATIKVIQETILRLPNVPVILDPILKAGGGKKLVDNQLIIHTLEQLFPHTTVCTPNAEEAKTIANLMNPAAKTIIDYAQAIQTTGCQQVLITDAGTKKNQVTNQLFTTDTTKPQTLSWPKLPNAYHGSGCTLAASLTAFIAQEIDVTDANEKAQQYTWQALKQGQPLGKGQWIPRRGA